LHAVIICQGIITHFSCKVINWYMFLIVCHLFVVHSTYFLVTVFARLRKILTVIIAWYNHRQVQKSDWINIKKNYRPREITLALISKLTFVKSQQTSNSFGLKKTFFVRSEVSDVSWSGPTFVPVLQPLLYNHDSSKNN